MKGIKIQELDTEDFVYDIEVEENHNFFANDILVHNCFISLAPKMYFTRIWDNEGVKLTKHKMKVTGLSMIRSNTPKFFKDRLKPMLEFLIEADIDSVMAYIKETKELMYLQDPKDLAINVSVSRLDYTWDEQKKSYLKWNGEKFLSCPINSRAAIKHNEFLKETGANKYIRDIMQGEKISYIQLIEPNPAKSDIIAFKDPNVFDVETLVEYIDYQGMFNKCFMANIKLITDPLKWELIEEANKINEDDW
jgi:DNA polymerase elongation subunit (family B)